jgi:succinylglutamate desuccinylase
MSADAFQQDSIPRSGERQHIIASIRGARRGPSLIVVGGIHGNEPAGVLACRRVAHSLKGKESGISGDIHLFVGNTRACERGARYLEDDLNRRWQPSRVAALTSGKLPDTMLSEDFEVEELCTCLRHALETARGEVFFLDLHTTSAHGAPFATVGDTLRNRTFARNFPITKVLGLEEQIDGSLLEFMNNLGVVTMGFEAGQHEAELSADYHETVVWIALVASGVLDRTEAPELAQRCASLEHAGGGVRVVEVRYRHSITEADCFKMEPGFENFSPVQRGQLLARDRQGPVSASESGMILMPLYQALGSDGFFLAREVNPFWLRISEMLRRLRVGNYIHMLPGVRRDRVDRDLLFVNTHVARFLPMQVFHLLGFRKQQQDGELLTVSRRRYDLNGPLKHTIS